MCDTATIVRISGGLCWADLDGDTIQCMARGNVKRGAEGVMVGDIVRVSPSPDGEGGVLEKVLPRRNKLTRPQVANVDQAVVVTAVRQPDPNINLLERILVQVEHAGLDVVVCFTKADLASPAEYQELVNVYRCAGFATVVTSTGTGQGVDDLRSLLSGKVSVFAGPSGAGKSALLNAVQPGYGLAEGGISSKIGRGRHTTREVRLLRLHTGGFVADSPGFSVLDLAGMEPEQLGYAYPDIRRYLGECRFAGCMHDAEPDCAVKRALEDGKLNPVRYEHYLIFLEELRQAQRDMYR